MKKQVLAPGWIPNLSLADTDNLHVGAVHRHSLDKLNMSSDFLPQNVHTYFPWYFVGRQINLSSLRRHTS